MTQDDVQPSDPPHNENCMTYTDFFKARMEVTKGYCESAKGFV
jgi:hypothetical protein